MPASVRYLPAAGDPINFTNSVISAGIRLQHGARGLLAPPVVLHIEDLPGIDGSELVGSRYGSRQVTLPILLRANTKEEYRQRLAALVAATHAHDGLGELEVNTDGVVRRLKCILTGGLEGDQDTDAGGGVETWWRTILEFYAPDPFWYDANWTMSSWAYPAAVPWFPFTPLVLGPSQTLGDTIAVNAGNVDTYPVWIMTGPFTDATFTNNKTGEWLKITGPVVAGRTVVVNTIDSETDIVATNPLENYWSHLEPGSILWGLSPGSTSISLTLTGSGPGTTVRADYRQRWLAP